MPLSLGEGIINNRGFPISQIDQKLDQARQHAATGQIAQAERLFREILAIDEKHRESLETLVMICLQTRRPDQAEQHLHQLIAIFPTESIYTERLVTLLKHRGRNDDAIGAYRELLQRNPGLSASRYNLARLLKQSGQLEEALREYETCLQHGIERPEEVHTNISIIHGDLQRHDAARQSLETALELRPDHLPALFNKALLEEEAGDWDNALRLFRKILELEPAHPGALAHIANGQITTDPVDPLIRKLKRVLRRTEAVSPEREELLYALGKTHDDCGKYDKAFDYYQQANDLSSRRSEAYQAAAQEKLVDELIAGCNADWLRTVEPVSEDAHIFICGMFRSGSTLVEQILTAHPGVTAGGEINYFQRRASPFPAAVLAMDSRQLTALGQGYNTLLREAFPEAERISNKRPDNFLYLGLLMAMYPNARIIHTRRQPLDNCLSLFFQPMDNKLAYANSLQSAGHYYLQYRRVMEHWQQFSEDRILPVDYESLVSAPRETIAGILAFLQLDWHEDCLEFHQLRNRVRTASLHQVRQPMYQHSSGRWQNYAAAVTALRQHLVNAGISGLGVAS